MSRSRRWLAMPATMASLAACATAPAPAPPPPPVVPGMGPPACFEARQFQDYRVLDQSSLVIYAPNRANAYYVRVSPPSPDLANAPGLALVPATGPICGYAGQRLVVSRGSLDRRFAIVSVTRLTPDGEQALRESPADARTAQPQGGPGATVERDLD